MFSVFESANGGAFGETSKYGLRLIVPRRPILSVVEGAAHFGNTPDYIKGRRLKSTYGLGLSFAAWKARSLGVDEDYIDRRSSMNGRVEDCFDVLIKKDELVHTNQVKLFTVYCLSQTAALKILRSDLTEPKTSEDGELLAVIQIDNGPNWRGTKAIVEFHFYDTLLRVYAYSSKDTHKKKSVNIVYQS